VNIPVSAVLITKNAEAVLNECLSSLSWCDEIVVVDSGSTDSTLAICKAHNCRIIHQDFLGFGAQKNFSVLQAKNDWVLHIDADEVVIEDLKQSILVELPKHHTTAAAFQLPRTLIFFGQKFNYGRENKQAIVRLFNKNQCNYDLAEVHEKLIVNGSTQSLKGELLHYSYASLFEYFEKFNIYTSKGALEQVKRNKSRSRILVFLFTPFYFFKFYILERNFMNGYAGLLWAIISSFYVFIKYNKLYESMYIHKNNLK